MRYLYALVLVLAPLAPVIAQPCTIQFDVPPPQTLLVGEVGVFDISTHPPFFDAVCEIDFGPHADPPHATLFGPDPGPIDVAFTQAGVFEITVGCFCPNGTNVIHVVTVLDPDPLDLFVSSNGVDFCANLGSSLLLSTNVSGGAPPYQYSWIGPAGFSSTLKNPVVLINNTNQSGTYTLIVTDAEGETTSASADIFVQQPVPIITGSIPICPGAAATLSTSEVYGQYQWSTGATSPTIFASLPGIYSVTVTDDFGCTGVASATVALAPGPQLTAGANSPCEGESLLLTCSATGGAPPYSFAWADPFGAPVSSQQNPVIAPATLAMTGTYTVKVTDSQGCSAQQSAHVAIRPRPVAALSARMIVAENSEVKLRANIAPQTFDDATGSIVWTGPGFSSIEENPVISNIEHSGAYIVEVTNQAGCTTFDTTTIEVIGDIAGIPYSRQSDHYTLASTCEDCSTGNCSDGAGVFGSAIESWDMNAQTVMPPPRIIESLSGLVKTAQPNIKGLPPCGCEVNTYTGNLFIEVPLFAIPSIGPDLTFTLVYNSGTTARNSGYGRGWTWNYNLRWERQGNDILIRRGDGRTDLFTHSAAGYHAPPGVFDTLIESATDQFRLRTKRGQVFHFNTPAHGRLTSIEDRNGNVLHIAFADSLATLITDATGRTLQLKYEDGLLAEVKESNTGQQRIAAIQYNADGILHKIADPGGYERQYQPDAKGRYQQIADPNGNLVELKYTDRGALAGMRSALADMQIEYDTLNQETAIIEPVGNTVQTTRHGFDSLGRILYTTGACCGFDVQYEHDQDNNITRFTSAMGYVYQYRYDTLELGNVVEAVDPLNNVHRYEWSATFGHLIGATDKNGNETLCKAEDGHGNITKIEMPDGGVETFDWYPNGLLARMVGADGDTTVYAYDAHGHPKTKKRPVGTEEMGHDAIGNLVFLVTPNGDTTTFAQDELNRMVQRTDPLGYPVKYGYDGNGNTIWQQDEAGFYTTNQCDAHNRRVQQTRFLAAGQTAKPDQGPQNNPTDRVVTRYAYDQKNLVAMTDPRGFVTRWTYNNKNQRIQETNALGHTRSWIYNANGEVIEESDFEGGTVTYDYDFLDRRIARTDELGNAKEWAYDPNGNNTEVAGPKAAAKSANPPAGVSSKFSYDKMNRMERQEHGISKSETTYSQGGDVVAEKDPNGNVTKYFYNSNHWLVRVEDPLGYATTYKHDANGNVVEITDKRNNTTRFGYDALNREVLQINAKGDSVLTTYDGRGYPVAVRNERGFTTTRTYDGLGRVTEIAYPIGTVKMEYDAAGNLVKEIDPLNRETLHAFDSLGRRTKTTFPDMSMTLYGYDKNSNLSSVTNEEGETTTYAYDAKNQKIGETNPMGETTEYRYNNLGQLVAVKYPNGREVHSVYDQEGRVISQYDNFGTISLNEYDDAGNTIKQTDANGNSVTSQVDALHRVVQTTDAMGQSAFFLYDPNGNMVEYTDRNGNKTTQKFDALDLPEEQTNTLLHKIVRAYDKARNLASITDAKGNTTSYKHDGNNRQTEEIFADGTTKVYTLDAVGNTLARKDNAGNVTNYIYDLRNRLTHRDYPGANDDQFGYDLAGRMLTAANQYAAISLTYDSAGRLLSEILNGKTTGYAYDIPNNTRTLTYPSGLTVVEQLDERGRLAQVGAGGSELARWYHDPADRTLARRYANGTLARHTHNPNDWTTSLQHANAVGVFAGFNHAFDREGNKKYEAKIHRPGESERYGYDDIYRLDTFQRGVLSAQSYAFEELFQYDPLGNRKQMWQNGVPTTYTANEMNENTSISGQPNPVHDDNGNMTFDGTHSYQYDVENRLISVDSGATARYFYDALGRRIRKETAADTSNFYFSGWRELEEYDEADTLAKQWVYGIYIDEMLAMLRPSLPPLYYHQNTLYSVHALTDETGKVVEGYQYDAFGKPTVFGPGANGRVDFGGDDALGNASFLGNPCLFTGRWLDGETGGYYYRMRVMHSGVGRFLQRDPRGLWGDHNNQGNGYSYVGLKPTRILDPIGAQGIEDIKKPGDRVTVKKCDGVCYPQVDIKRNCEFKGNLYLKYDPDKLAWAHKWGDFLGLIEDAHFVLGLFHPPVTAPPGAAHFVLENFLKFFATRQKTLVYPICQWEYCDCCWDAYPYHTGTNKWTTTLEALLKPIMVDASSSFRLYQDNWGYFAPITQDEETLKKFFEEMEEYGKSLCDDVCR